MVIVLLLVKIVTCKIPECIVKALSGGHTGGVNHWNRTVRKRLA